MTKDKKALRVDVSPIRMKIQQAVSESGYSLHEIARMSGLSVPTISRVFHSQSGTVHVRTAKAIEDALVGRTGTKRSKASYITKSQEESIIVEVVKALRKELAKARNQ